MASRGQAPVSKLFVSCDLVGSTQFKQTEPGWQRIFLSFYRQFPQILDDANRSIPTGEKPITDFQLWKAVGDELIFEAAVNDEQGISRAVRVWLLAIKMYEDQILEGGSLALKGGAFIATFPGPDSESTIPRRPNSETSDKGVVALNDEALRGKRNFREYLYDYFGPSIDTGFRVYGLATRRYFTLSVEVAWAMGLAAHQAAGTKDGHGQYSTTGFVFHGAHQLKGVWGAREYPVFAIDRDLDDEVNKALAKMNGKELKPLQIVNVCHACSADKNWPFKLYLPGSNNSQFLVKPENAMADLLDSESTLEGAETAISESSSMESSDDVSLPMG